VAIKRKGWGVDGKERHYVKRKAESAKKGNLTQLPGDRKKNQKKSSNRADEEIHRVRNVRYLCRNVFRETVPKNPSPRKKRS